MLLRTDFSTFGASAANRTRAARVAVEPPKKDLSKGFVIKKYCSLQMAKYDVKKERERIVKERRQFKLEFDAAKAHAQTQIECLQKKLADAEKAAAHQIEHLFLDVPGTKPRGRPKQRWLDTMHADLETVGVHPDQAYDGSLWRQKIDRADPVSKREKICALEAELARPGELPSMALMGDDTDWTSKSEGDKIAEQLRKQLNSCERENEELRKANEEQKKLLEKALSGANSQNETFTIGKGGNDKDLLQTIDHLETRLREEEKERNKTSSVLVTYMMRCFLLEKKIQDANLSCSNVSFTAKNKTKQVLLWMKRRKEDSEIFFYVAAAKRVDDHQRSEKYTRNIDKELLIADGSLTLSDGWSLLIYFHTDNMAPGLSVNGRIQYELECMMLAKNRKLYRRC
ncbi:hypothetical protein Q1695_001647 [Nippostrongylus brasiliensis]|nr:hypothetical protein Q1695_001647 [Nippostrongylus brasiliensis]